MRAKARGDAWPERGAPGVDPFPLQSPECPAAEINLLVNACPAPPFGSSFAPQRWRTPRWWRMTEELERATRRIAVQDGAAIAYIGATHELWPEDEKRFGVVRPLLRSD